MALVEFFSKLPTADGYLEIAQIELDFDTKFAPGTDSDATGEAADLPGSTIILEDSVTSIPHIHAHELSELRPKISTSWVKATAPELLSADDLTIDLKGVQLKRHEDYLAAQASAKPLQSAIKRNGLRLV